MKCVSRSKCEFVTHSPDGTLYLGGAISKSMTGGIVVGLVGPLGAGKTLLVKGIAQHNAGGLCEVTSPTFTLVQEYAGRLTIYHLDVYRLPRPDDPLMLSLDEMLRPDSFVIIEWADRVRHKLPEDVLWINVIPSGESTRRFEFHAVGPASKAVLEHIQREFVDTRVQQS